MNNKKQIVIIGAGFAGLKLARTLNNLFLLISFKNKLIVFINWIYKYFTHRQSLSLLFEPLRRK
jgi:NADH dehydrogenase FAD-containing subunit